MNWFKIARPVTFTASIAPVAVGIASAKYCTGNITSRQWIDGTIILLTAIFIQIFSNFANDLYDFRRGEDSSPTRLGPGRAISKGLVSEKQMTTAMLVSLAFAVAGGIYLIVLGGFEIAVIGITAILFAYLYSATKHSLSHTGMADIFCFMYYGPIATMGTTYLLTGYWDSTSFTFGAGCGAISVALLTINNLRDIEEDKAHGKMTLVARGGETFGKVYYTFAICVPAAILFVTADWISGTIFAIVCVTNNLTAFFRLYNRKFNMLLGYASLYNILYAASIICYVLISH